jgi:hypothetical protein
MRQHNSMGAPCNSIARGLSWLVHCSYQHTAVQLIDFSPDERYMARSAAAHTEFKQHEGHA